MLGTVLVPFLLFQTPVRYEIRPRKVSLGQIFIHLTIYLPRVIGFRLNICLSGE